MAEINITYDTISKELSVTMNGQKLDDVRYIHVNNYYDKEPSISIEMKPKEQDGMCFYTNVTASIKDQKYEFNKYLDAEKSIAYLTDKTDFHKKIAEAIMRK